MTNLTVSEILDRLVGKNVLPNAYAHSQVDANAITKAEAERQINELIREARIEELDDYLQWYMGRPDATILTDRQVVEELISRISERETYEN